MKTLDEVIFEAPYTMTPWEENAIYYLKEYRDHMKNEIIELQEEVKKQKEMIEFLEKPLTWDELKQMEGKPVWVEHEGYTPGWEIVENNGAVRGSAGDFTGRFVETNMSILRKEEQGITWQAYRKERDAR